MPCAGSDNHCVSQGSSGSELDEVGKLLHILAAMRPEVRCLATARRSTAGRKVDRRVLDDTARVDGGRI